MGLPVSCHLQDLDQFFLILIWDQGKPLVSWHRQPKGIDPSYAVVGAGPSRLVGTSGGTTLGPQWANFAEIQKTLRSFLAQCERIVRPSLGFSGEAVPTSICVAGQLN